MRGELWEVTGRPFHLLVVQHPALAAAPTITGLAVTERPQRAGPPLALALAGGWWVKTNQVHTVPATECTRRVGRLDAAAMAAVERALAQVLGLPAP